MIVMQPRQGTFNIANGPQNEEKTMKMSEGTVDNSLTKNQSS